MLCLNVRASLVRPGDYISGHTVVAVSHLPNGVVIRTDADPTRFAYSSMLARDYGDRLTVYRKVQV